MAGIELVNDEPTGWIRPVSIREGAEINLEERPYEHGSEPKLLDVVDVTFSEPRPHHHQTENHLIDDTVYWGKVDTLRRSQVDGLVEDPQILWINGHHSSQGLNDKVPEAEAHALGRSLYLIRPTNLELIVGKDAWTPSRRRVWARFRFRSADYFFAVSDLEVENTYLKMVDGTYKKTGTPILCVSLTEAFKGSCYKVVAAVIE